MNNILAAILAILGLILFGFSVISFIIVAIIDIDLVGPVLGGTQAFSFIFGIIFLHLGLKIGLEEPKNEKTAINYSYIKHYKLQGDLALSAFYQKQYLSKAKSENALKLPDEIIENTEPASSEKAILKVNFSIESITYAVTPLIYPQFFIPKIGTSIKPTQDSEVVAKKGVMENPLYNLLKTYFGEHFDISNSKILLNRGPSKPYHPDITLINLENNIFIDIEIDEPYDGISRIPTHVKGKDVYRNNFFTERGWIVIRFAEIQVATQAKSCCQEINNFIREINSALISSSLDELSIPKLNPCNVWDDVQSREWAKINFREEYLGITDFSFEEISKKNIIVTPTQTEIFIEDSIEISIPKTYFEEIEYSGSDFIKQDRNKRLAFDEENHRYYIDGNPDTISVSELISVHFPKFDADKAIQNIFNSNNWNESHKYWGLSKDQIKAMWKYQGEDAAKKGSYLHKQIENYYKNQNYDDNSKEFLFFLDFINTFDTITPIKTEFRIFDEDHMIAGTVDMLYKKPNGDYFIIDWKRSNRTINPLTKKPIIDGYENAFGGLNHLENNNYNKYALQQNLYKYILEKHYKDENGDPIRINSMNLLILHPDYDEYILYKVPEMEPQLNYILSTIY